VTAELFSPRWLDAARWDGPLADPLTVRLCVTDPAPGTVADVLAEVDETTGALGFRPTPSGVRPAMTFTLSRAEALMLLFGGPRERVELFETGTLRLEGVFLLVYFFDVLLQEDRLGVVRDLRERTAGAPPESAPWPRPIPGPRDGSGSGLDGEVSHVLPRTTAVLRRELGTSTPGVQLAVSHAASGARLSVAAGLARPGVPFTTAAAPLWYCCAKPLGAVAIGQLWERGLLDIHAPLAEYLPRFAGHGRDAVTAFQVLTHTTVLPVGADPMHGCVTAPRDVRRDVLARTVFPDDVSGERINYAPWWGWFVLAELVEAVDGRDFDDYLAAEILRPCGMHRTRTSIPPAEFERIGGELPLIHVSPGGRAPVPTLWFSTPGAAAESVPGLNTRGPVSDLVLLLEALLSDGRGENRLLAAPTAAALTARHRVGLTDVFGNADWGLGFRVESRHLGTRHRSFGSTGSLRAFGHHGLGTSVAFADPDDGLVLALHFNGQTEQHRHLNRTLTVCDAVRADLRAAQAATRQETA
jgi:CubicO group peptidase (beta-lactamase class C family)